MHHSLNTSPMFTSSHCIYGSMESHSFPTTHDLVHPEKVNSKILSSRKYGRKNTGPGLLDLQLAVPEDILQKERDRFSQIFEKYSTQDDTVVNDVVDIYTGKVIEDNGHLKSLTDQEGGVSGLGLVTDLWVEDFNLLSLPHRRKIIERLHSIQKKHQLLGKFSDFIETSSPASERLESPTKKQRRSSFESSSPLKADSLNTLFPKLDHEDRDTYLESPTRSGDNVLSYFDDPGEDSDASSETSGSSEDYDSDLASFIVFECVPKAKVYLCAFLSCQYSSELRNDYERHLLNRHCDELAQLGYPVTPKNPVGPRKAIPDVCILRLKKQFPLAMDLPLEPFRCRINLKHGPCKKLFLNQDTLLAHQKEASGCSSRRQVLQCPVLGCDYITEESYDILLMHAKTHRYVDLHPFHILKGEIPLLSASKAPAAARNSITKESENNTQRREPDQQELSECLDESSEISTSELRSQKYKATPSVGLVWDLSESNPNTDSLEELFSD